METKANGRQWLMLHKFLRGFSAGLLSAPVGLLFAYLVGVLATALKTREVLATLLVAGSVLPLMLIFVLLVPTLVISLITGIALALVSNLTTRLNSAIGALIGVVVAELILTAVLPQIIIPQPQDFTSIVSQPLVSGAYGFVLGGFAGIFFRWLNRTD